MSRAGVDLSMAVKTLAEYGEAVMPLAVRGLEKKTLDPYMAGWHKRVVPDLGHLAVRMITYGVVDRAVHGWIADGCGRSTIKNSLAILVRVLEQAVRDGFVEYNRARITGWHREYSSPRTNSVIRASSPCRIGTRWSTWPPRWLPGRQASTPDGAASLSSPRAPQRASARPQACAAAT